MKSLFLVGCSLKDQYRTKAFLEKEYQVEANVSVHHSIDTAKNKSYDLILYDADNPVPLKYFFSELSSKKISTPIVLLSSKMKISEVQELRSLGVVALIKKPYSKKEVLKGVFKGFKVLESSNETQKGKKQYKINQAKADILIGLKKHAIVTQLHEKDWNSCFQS